MVAHRDGRHACLLSVGESSEAQEDHAVCGPPLPEDELSEILVTGHEDGAPGRRSFENLLIRGGRHILGDIFHLVAILPQPLDDLPLDALVPEQLQAASSGTE